MPIDWLERLLGEAIVVGFHSSDFVIYDLAEQRTVASVHCGGSQRSWDLAGDCSALAFVKDKQLCLTSLPASGRDEEAVIKPAFHPREQRCSMIPVPIKRSLFRSFGQVPRKFDPFPDRFTRIEILRSDGIASQIFA